MTRRKGKEQADTYVIFIVIDKDYNKLSDVYPVSLSFFSLTTRWPSEVWKQCLSLSFSGGVHGHSLLENELQKVRQESKICSKIKQS